ncbi:putative Zn-dependent peptidase [Rhodoligotrophos appendicifer]|uniref:M16 family metallopeptidase n=1 Tax=Rhodoligotrophos appendicifer TaxID=987056 RepID=UPI0011867DF4|nr:pitrilysin family protein [Rhodoligotrophos appendicifer]
MGLRTSALANGVTVVSHDMPHLKTVSLGIYVKAGARSERESENGIAHLLEHMAFKGTERRSARQIAEEIESAGGEMNAATGMESTAYYARVLKEDLALAMDVLSDILIHPVFQAPELEREREVILEEISAAEDTPDDLVFDLLHEAAYPDQPLGRPILGTSDRVMNFSASDIIKFRDAHYSGNRIVVAAAGAVNHDALVTQAEVFLGGLRAVPTAEWTKASFVGGIRTATKPLGQVHVVLSFPAMGYRDENIYTLQILSGLLGGGMSSRLFQDVREARGLCYSIFSFASAFDDTGIFGVYAATSPRRVDELLNVTADTLTNISEQVTEQEIARSRAQLKASLVSALESSSARADQIARQQLVFGRIPEMDELVSRVEAVDMDAVARLAKRLFHGTAPAVGAVGALENLATYDNIAERFA